VQAITAALLHSITLNRDWLKDRERKREENIKNKRRKKIKILLFPVHFSPISTFLVKAVFIVVHI
jgi:hypothetical protein